MAATYLEPVGLHTVTIGLNYFDRLRSVAIAFDSL